LNNTQKYVFKKSIILLNRRRIFNVY